MTFELKPNAKVCPTRKKYGVNGESWTRDGMSELPLVKFKRHFHSDGSVTLKGEEPHPDDFSDGKWKGVGFDLHFSTGYFADWADHIAATDPEFATFVIAQMQQKIASKEWADVQARRKEAKEAGRLKINLSPRK